MFIAGVFLITSPAWLGLGIAVISEYGLKAQEKPVRELRSWQMIQLPPMAFLEPGTRIDVVDTEGVCIYVARWSNGMQISTVPKTQLPKGTGCQ